MSHRKIGPLKNGLKRTKQEVEEEKQQHICKKVDEVSEAYKFVERRELTVKHADDLPLLGGLYSAQLLQMSRRAEPEPDFEDMDKPDGVLKLPVDGGIFHDGIPFHHFSLTALQPKHIRRLKKNGIELKHGAFSHAEDQQIKENWHSFAEAHQMAEDDAARLMSVATATETQPDHRERIRFIRASRFRPWMCSRLLDRSAGQVFRRCYHLYRVSNLKSGDTRDSHTNWTDEEDAQLLELFKQHGSKWEFIGNELLRARYDCCRRYAQLVGGGPKMAGGDAEEEEDTGGRECARKTEVVEADGGVMEEGAGPSDAAGGDDGKDEEWSRVEVARLYEYLCDHLPRMPVLVALIPRYQNADDEVNWADPKMRLSGRSEQERKEKWEQLKASFRSVREERDQSARVKDILRAVLPEDTRILARCRVAGTNRRRLLLRPSDHAKWMDKVREFCEEHSVERLEDIDKTQLEQTLKSSDAMFHFSMRAIWRKFRMMMFVGRTAGLFRMLPIGEDRLTVHLRLLVFILQHIEQLRVRKRTLRKYTRRFLRICEWPRRERFVLVDQAMHKPSGKKLERMRAEERQAVISLKE
uniref:Myb-like domain-containing protein n=1 Tax=Globodera rostochiensis TaxID=31243 RepID=A0A914GV66_GLORO